MSRHLKVFVIEGESTHARFESFPSRTVCTVEAPSIDAVLKMFAEPGQDADDETKTIWDLSSVRQGERHDIASHLFGFYVDDDRAGYDAAIERLGIDVHDVPPLNWEETEEEVSS